MTGPLKPQMSDAELKKRKRLSANTAIATSTLGLGALGMKGAGAGLSAIKGGKFRKMGGKLSEAANTTAIVSGGIGGASGYNFASVQRAEARKRNMVRKSNPFAEEIAKRDTSWKTIKQHETAAAGERKKQRQASAVTGAGLGVAATPFLANPTAANARKVGSETKGFLKSVKSGTNAVRSMRNPSVGMAARVGSNLVKIRPNGAMVAGGGALAAGGAASGAFHRGREMKHQGRADARRKRNAGIAKAYDPEAKRQKRTEGYSSAAKIGSGLSFGAAGVSGLNLLGKEQERTFQTRAAKTNVERGKAGVKVATRARNKAGLATAGLAGLGVGGMVASDRLKSYNRHGKGQSYKPRVSRDS